MWLYFQEQFFCFFNIFLMIAYLWFDDARKSLLKIINCNISINQS
jgi:hypothetical protein